MGRFSSVICISRPIYRPPDALLPEHCQSFAVHIQIHQGEVGAQPVMVFGHAPISDLVEAEDPFQNTERMLHPQHALAVDVELLLELQPPGQRR